MTSLNAAEISQLLCEIGDRMMLQGGNLYRAHAYRRAAESLALSTVPLDQLIAEGRLTEIPGVGDALAAVITRLHQTGKHPRLEAMRADIPEGVLEMLRIPGLRPDRIKKMFRELGIASVEQLEEAARTGRLASTKGFGPAFQVKVLQGIDMSRHPQGRHIHRATSAFSYASAELKRTHLDLAMITPAGELRRGCDPCLLKPGDDGCQHPLRPGFLWQWLIEGTVLSQDYLRPVYRPGLGRDYAFPGRQSRHDCLILLESAVARVLKFQTSWWSSV